MQHLSRRGYESARRFLDERGRLLDRALAAWAFDGAETNPVLGALGEYQNADGGFGHALEPDVRTPSSSALATAIALGTLSDLGTGSNSDPVRRAVNFLVGSLDETALTWRIVPQDANTYPHAPWWHDEDTSLEQGFGNFTVNPRAELVAQLWTYVSLVSADWLDRLTESTVAAIESRELDPHDLICAVRLAETPQLPVRHQQRVRPAVTARVQAMVAREPEQWREYNPQPLWFTSGPASLLSEPLAGILPANLDFLIDQQTTEGYWEPNWTWGDFYPETWPQAKADASSLLTLKALRQLDAFGRIER